MKTRIKICGFTRVDDALAAVSVGVDMLGLNFSPISPRQVNVAVAGEISAAVGRKATRVGLFVDQPAEEVQRLLDQVELDLLQFHGQESDAYCRSFDKPYIKVFRLDAKFAAERAVADYPDAFALLLDAFVAGVPGGTGQQIAPEFWPERSALPLILAGGLNTTNVEAAIVRYHPFGVDVSGGVEGATKGVKDHQKMANFVQAVQRVSEG